MDSWENASLPRSTVEVRRGGRQPAPCLKVSPDSSQIFENEAATLPNVLHDSTNGVPQVIQKLAALDHGLALKRALRVANVREPGFPQKSTGRLAQRCSAFPKAWRSSTKVFANSCMPAHRAGKYFAAVELNLGLFCFGDGTHVQVDERPADSTELHNSSPCFSDRASQSSQWLHPQWQILICPRFALTSACDGSHREMDTRSDTPPS